jgi:hypothetical protein
MTPQALASRTKEEVLGEVITASREHCVACGFSDASGKAGLNCYGLRKDKGISQTSALAIKWRSEPFG